MSVEQPDKGGSPASRRRRHRMRFGYVMGTLLLVFGVDHIVIGEVAIGVLGLILASGMFLSAFGESWSKRI
jgi:hypothetical protein